MEREKMKNNTFLSITTLDCLDVLRLISNDLSVGKFFFGYLHGPICLSTQTVLMSRLIILFISFQQIIFAGETLKCHY